MESHLTLVAFDLQGKRVTHLRVSTRGHKVTDKREHGAFISYI